MHILLVEDNEDVSAITVEYLSELGHQAFPVVNAEDAIAALRHTHFDAVMTDVSLPGMSGIALTKELARSHPRLPVVIASGYGAMNVELSLGEKPMRNVFVLPKPYDLAALENVLGKAAALSRP